MADEVADQGQSPLGRYNLPDKGGLLDESVHLEGERPFWGGEKRGRGQSRRRRLSSRPFTGKRASASALDALFENPENVDPELILLFKNFINEKFGVDLTSLEKRLDLGPWEYSTWEKQWLAIPDRVGMKPDEKGFLCSWVDNRRNLLDNVATTEELRDSLKVLFDNWLDKESSASAGLLKRTNWKVRQFFALEKDALEEERKKPPGRKLVFLFVPDRLGSRYQKDKIKEWLEAWDSGKVEKVILNPSPVKEQKIVRIGLRFDSKEGKKETFVNFSDFCRAFGLAEDPHQKITPEINIEGFFHWWRGHEFVFLPQNVPVEEGEVKNTKAEVLIVPLPGKRERTS